jgi:hypothetical protein
MIALGAFKVGVEALAGAALAAVAAAPAMASTADRSWIGVEKILVLAQLTPAIQTTPNIQTETLCRKVATIAAAGAPVPVECAQLGDPALQSGRTAVLSIQAAITDAVPGQKLLLFTIKRNAEGGLEPAPIYFGSTPRAVALPQAGDPNLAIDGAIRASLSEILPWLNLDQGELPRKR